MRIVLYTLGVYLAFSLPLIAQQALAPPVSHRWIGFRNAGKDYAFSYSPDLIKKPPYVYTILKFIPSNARVFRRDYLPRQWRAGALGGAAYVEINCSDKGAELLTFFAYFRSDTFTKIADQVPQPLATDLLLAKYRLTEMLCKAQK